MKKEKLTFEATEIKINSESVWDEIISLTFNKEDSYIAIARLAHEEDIYLERDDQINFIMSKYSDMIFDYKEDSLEIFFKNVIDRSNMPDSIHIFWNKNLKIDLGKVISMLKKDTLVIKDV